MAIEEVVVADLTAHGYHPRTSSHSDRQSEQIVLDLLASCPAMRERALTGKLVGKLRHHQQVGHDDWVIDLAIGTSAGAALPPDAGQPIRFAPPAIIQVAIELKSIFTEHGKARKNRLRDFNAFHGYAHSYDPKTIAGAFLIVNAAEYFYSPLRKPEDITQHGGKKASAKDVAGESVKLFRTIALRNGAQDPPGLEAIAVLVIEHDNLNVHPDRQAHKAKHRPTRVLHSAPAPQVGDPLHYQTFIQRICSQFTARFA
jgi:hypothetical protein